MPTSTCDVSTIFSGGGPSNAGASVMVGGKQLIPSPFLNIALEKYKAGDLTIGGVLKVTLNGNVVGSSFNEVVTTGAGGVTGLKDILQIGQYRECVYVEIKCDSTIIKGYGRITSLNISEGNMPTWVNMAPYTIEIDLFTNDIGLSFGERPAYPGKIESSGSSSSILNDLMLNNLSEQFSVSINDDTFNWAGGSYPTGMSDWSDFKGWGNRHIKTNFSISAGGIRGLTDCNGGSTETGHTYGLAAAEAYIRDRIEKLRDMNIAGVFNPPTSELTQAFATYRGGISLLDFRTIDVNPIENSISVTGEIIYRPSGCSSGPEDKVFTTLNVEQSLDGEGETITLTGNIQGLVDNNFDKIIKMSVGVSDNIFTNCNLNEKISNANNFLTRFAKEENLKSIANYYYNNEGFFDDVADPGYIKDNCPLSAGSDPCSSASPSPSPTTPELCALRLVSSQINRNLSQGEINFTFVLSNKANCNILGAKKVDVEITHDKPRDNIVEFIIPGRGDKGVLIQNLCCKSAEKYDIAVTATLNKNSCSFNISQSTIQELRACAEKVLEDLQNDNNINLDCWFKVNDQETIGNNVFRLNMSYVKPSCP